MRSWRPRHLRKPSPGLVVNGILGVALLAAAVASYRTVAVADTATTGTSASRAVAVSQGQVVSSVSASGSVQSAATASANFVTAGTVTEIDVKVGDAVKKDQVLAKVSPTTAQEQLTAAQANLTSAQQSLGRAQSATSPDAATIAAAQAQVTQAQNSVNSAQRAVDGTTLTAPMDGTVIAINGTVGGSSNSGSSSGGSSTSASSGGGSSSSNNATTGNNSTNGQNNNSNTSSNATGSTGFIQLADLGKLLVSASFAEADATKLTVNQAATVTWAALSGARTTGKITTIAPTATTQNNVNSYAVTVSLDTPPDGVRIGQTVTVSVIVAQATDAVRVPAAAVRGTGQRHTVEVVTGDGKRETRQVEVGVQGDQFVEITSGLSPGEQVALNLPTTTGTTTNRFGGGGQGGIPGGGGFTGGGGNGGNRGGGGTRGTG
jgi:macrolide-specific efflux system membrane fusion protein